MKHILLLCMVLAISTGIHAQHSINLSVKSHEGRSLAGASVSLKGSNKTTEADSSGVAVLQNIPAGKYTLIISYVGMEEKEITVNVPAAETIAVELEDGHEHEEEVIINSTRTSRTIDNVPTRVETIELEEIDEKSNMRPSNVAMILHESTGIQVQQTSATSANAGIRIQGLDGRYTQLLKDGFPNFGNFSSGLSVLEIPPLDLKQVEIIKGPASPLFGGGAIAGVINFISRTPKAEPSYNFLINQSNIGQTNIGGFAAVRGKKAGYTLLALYNTQKEYDVDGDDFTEVPRSIEYTIYPKLFLYPSENTTLTIGNSFNKGERKGGDIFMIRREAVAGHTYEETNETVRNISTVEFDKKIGDKKRFVARQSFSIYEREVAIPFYAFSGTEHTAFTDISYVTNKANHALVVGANFIFNNFRETMPLGPRRHNKISTGGIYGQHTWDASEKVKLETGLRVDLANYRNAIYSNTEVFVLPRMSLLVKYNSKLSSRIGAGIGYKTPTLFTEETETIQYRNVAQLNNVTSEISYGGTADVNYRTMISAGLSLSINHMFFYTLIDNPLLLMPGTGSGFQFANSTGHIHSAGFESNIKFIYRNNFKLFLGYTYTNAKGDHLAGNKSLLLVPRGKLNSALIYEKHEVVKIGLEGYFTGRQYLSNGSRSPSYSEFGFMAEKIFKKFSIYINFENFTDTRQGKYKNVVNGPHENPTFDEIWTHTEGFVFNGGMKIKL